MQISVCTEFLEPYRSPTPSPREAPSALNEISVPAQQRAWCDEQVPATGCRQYSGQCTDDRAIRPREAWTGDLTTQHGQLVPQHQNLRVLGRPRTREQNSPGDQPKKDQIHQTQRHNHPSCPTPVRLESAQVNTCGRVSGTHRLRRGGVSRERRWSSPGRGSLALPVGHIPRKAAHIAAFRGIITRLSPQSSSPGQHRPEQYLAGPHVGTGVGQTW
jgi:hypothetical protein